MRKKIVVAFLVILSGAKRNRRVPRQNLQVAQRDEKPGLADCVGSVTASAHSTSLKMTAF
jgi:hypothetical protein